MAVNPGTMERIKVIDAAGDVGRYLGHAPKYELPPEMPKGLLRLAVDYWSPMNLPCLRPQANFWERKQRKMDRSPGTDGSRSRPAWKRYLLKGSSERTLE